MTTRTQVAELRQRVAELGLDTKGTKAELIARVEKFISEQGGSHIRRYGTLSFACLFVFLRTRRAFRLHVA